MVFLKEEMPVLAFEFITEINMFKGGTRMKKIFKRRQSVGSRNIKA
jgi:hypothetical protein